MPKDFQEKLARGNGEKQRIRVFERESQGIPPSKMAATYYNSAMLLT